MKLAKSILLEDEEVLDHATNKPCKTVMWPATKQTKTTPLLKEYPDNSLKDLKFWMYDPVTGQAIKSYPRYEVCAKRYTGAIAQIMVFKLWPGQRTRVETQLFGPYVGRTLLDLRKKQKKQTKKCK
ncbi:hypothetical protein Hanom_Chr13g01196691 [Helianthus anomalus]